MDNNNPKEKLNDDDYVYIIDEKNGEVFKYTPREFLTFAIFMNRFMLGKPSTDTIMLDAIVVHDHIHFLYLLFCVMISREFEFTILEEDPDDYFKRKHPYRAVTKKRIDLVKYLLELRDELLNNPKEIPEIISPYKEDYKEEDIEKNADCEYLLFNVLKEPRFFYLNKYHFDELKFDIVDIKNPFFEYLERSALFTIQRFLGPIRPEFVSLVMSSFRDGLEDELKHGEERRFKQDQEEKKRLIEETFKANGMKLPKQKSSIFGWFKK